MYEPNEGITSREYGYINVLETSSLTNCIDSPSYSKLPHGPPIAILTWLILWLLSTISEYPSCTFRSLILASEMFSLFPILFSCFGGIYRCISMQIVPFLFESSVSCRGLMQGFIRCGLAAVNNCDL